MIKTCVVYMNPVYAPRGSGYHRKARVSEWILRGKDVFASVPSQRHAALAIKPLSTEDHTMFEVMLGKLPTYTESLAMKYFDVLLTREMKHGSVYVGWKHLCSCLFETLSEKQQIMLTGQPDETPTQYDIPTRHHSVSFEDLLLAASLFQWVTLSIFYDNTPPASGVEDWYPMSQIIENLHIIHGQRLLSHFFNSDVQEQISRFQVYTVSALRTGEADAVKSHAGAREEKFIPFATTILRSLVEIGEIQREGWTVLFEVRNNHQGPGTLHASSDRMRALSDAYRKIGDKVHSIFFVFEDEVSFDSSRMVRPVVFLLIRDPRIPGKVAFTVIDFFWIDKNKDIAAKILNFVGAMASTLGIASYTMIVPDFFKRIWDKDVLPHLNEQYFQGYDGRRMKFSLDGSAIPIWFGCKGTDLDIFKRNPCLDALTTYECVRAMYKKGHTYMKNPVTSLETLVEGYTDSYELSRTVYYPLTWICMYLQNMNRRVSSTPVSIPDSFQQMNRFLSSTATQVNTHIIACVLAGAYVISPFTVNYILTPSASVFFKFDGLNNFPSDVIVYCLAHDEDTPIVRAMRCTPGDFTCSFKIEKIHLRKNIGIETQKYFLLDLKKIAQNSHTETSQK